MDSEVNRKYVSSRGLLKMCAYHSETPSSSISKIINYPNFVNFRNFVLQNRLIPTIYVCNRAIPSFQNEYLKQIDFPFVLLSGDSDEDMPKEVFNSIEDLKNFLENKYLLHWYCQNWLAGNHPKVTLMPIGMDYHTMVTSDMWGRRMSVELQEKAIEDIKKLSKPFYEREIKCYINFLSTLGRRKDRKDAVDQIDKELVEYEKIGTARVNTWLNQIKYAFVVSPHGGGMDCHRTWEALILGCIPIVKRSPLDELYDELPVLIINDWSDITKELLENTIEEFKQKEFNYDKLTLQYWIRRFQTLK